MSKQCADCRDGEHDNYDDDVKLVIVKDPDERQFLKRANICGEHRRMYEGDGYEVKPCG